MHTNTEVVRGQNDGVALTPFLGNQYKWAYLQNAWVCEGETMLEHVGGYEEMTGSVDEGRNMGQDFGQSFPSLPPSRQAEELQTG